jgi:hypothetical protein
MQESLFGRLIGALLDGDHARAVAAAPPSSSPCRPLPAPQKPGRLRPGKLKAGPLRLNLEEVAGVKPGISAIFPMIYRDKQ